MLSHLPTHEKVSHQLIRNAALNEPRRFESSRHGGVAEAKTPGHAPCHHLFPQKRAVFCHDSAVRDQEATPRNYAAVIKVIVADHLEFSLVGAARVSICDLMCLDVFVQLILALF